MADTATIFSDVCAREFLVTGIIFAGLALVKMLTMVRRRGSGGSGI